MIVARGDSKESAMWHFTRISGIGAALGFGFVNAMSLDVHGKFARDTQRTATQTQGGSS